MSTNNQCSVYFFMASITATASSSVVEAPLGRLFLSLSNETSNLVPDAIPQHYSDLVHSPNLTVSIWDSFPITCQTADSQP